MSLEAITALESLESEEVADIWRSGMRKDATKIPYLRPIKDLRDKVISEVEHITGVSRDDIMGHSKKKEISRARQFCYYQMHKLNITGMDIARAFNVDHSTVHYGVNKIKNKISKMEESK